jgi:DNA-directed RNA polymerase subunit RPC12/RpoP
MLRSEALIQMEMTCNDCGRREHCAVPTSASATTFQHCPYCNSADLHRGQHVDGPTSMGWRTVVAPRRLSMN